MIPARYRAAITVTYSRPLPGGNPAPLMCDHAHATWQAAAKCGQVMLRQRIASTTTPAHDVRFRSVAAYVLIRSEETGGDWHDMTATG